MATWLKDAPMREEDIKKDTSAELQSKMPEATHLAQNGKLAEACEVLLAVEKIARLASDLPTLKEAAGAILRLCFEQKDWEQLCTQSTALCKRRQQKPQVITLVVQEGMKYVEQAPNDDTKIKYITALRAISDGKIFVEKERALLTKSLADIKERQGLVAEAADILQEVHVETYGAMTKLEKCEFILEQVRLTLAKKDYVRANIVAKKIVKKNLDEEGFENCKLKYYKLMMEYHTHENDTLELCRDWMAVYNTPVILADEKRLVEALEHALAFLILSPHDNHQHDLLHRVQSDKNLKKSSHFYKLATYFTTPEVISYPFPGPEQQALQNHPVFSKGPRAKEWLELVHTRVTEHNVRIISSYYTRVKMAHLAKLIGLTEEKAEAHISQLVSTGVIYAKIDRPAGIVKFLRPRPPEEQLTAWAADISELLNLVETTCHLVNKENMIHKLQA